MVFFAHPYSGQLLGISKPHSRCRVAVPNSSVVQLILSWLSWGVFHSYSRGSFTRIIQYLGQPRTLFIISKFPTTRLSRGPSLVEIRYSPCWNPPKLDFLLLTSTEPHRESGNSMTDPELHAPRDRDLVHAGPNSAN